MIGALLLLQAAAAPPASITVGRASFAAAVPVVVTASGPVVRADSVLRLLGGGVEHHGRGRHTIVLDSLRLELIEGVPYVRAAREVIPLARSPFGDSTQLFVPLHFVTAVLPRVARGVTYDVARAELRAGAMGPPTPLGVRARGGTERAPGRAGERAARRRIVVVDAGHGGPDRGMTGPIGARTKLAEKDITLAVARRLESALEERGVTVVMTRRTDTLIALADRGRIANAAHGDVFVSVHVNAANLAWEAPAAARGFETYFLAEAKTEDARRVEAMENEAVRFETGATAAKDDPLSFVITDMAQNEHLRESAVLAETIQRRLAGVHPGPSRGVKQAGFRVLVSAYMPAVLVEVGFGTNTAEARYLESAAGQRRLADALADATTAYLRRYERRVGVAGR